MVIFYLQTADWVTAFPRQVHVWRPTGTKTAKNSIQLLAGSLTTSTKGYSAEATYAQGILTERLLSSVSDGNAKVTELLESGPAQRI